MGDKSRFFEVTAETMVKMMVDGSMTEAELRSFFFDVRVRYAKKREEAKEEAAKKIREIAEQSGIAVSIKTKVAERASPAVKYRHGDNEWTGRGREPRWFREQLAAGKTREEMMA